MGNEQESAEERWRPILGVEQILMSVISLLSAPNADSPANIDAAVMFCENPKEWKKRVQVRGEERRLHVIDSARRSARAGDLSRRGSRRAGSPRPRGGLQANATRRRFGANASTGATYK